MRRVIIFGALALGCLSLILFLRWKSSDDSDRLNAARLNRRPDRDTPRGEPGIPTASASIRGTVRHLRTGSPLPGTVIELWDGQGKAAGVIAKAEGIYSLQALEAKTYTVKAKAISAAPLREVGKVTLEAGRAIDYDITLVSGPRVSGRVVASDGRALKEVHFDLTYQFTGRFSESKTLPLDAEGAFEFFLENIRGMVNLVARAPGYVPTAPTTLHIRKDDISGLEIKLNPGFPLEGIVINEEGQPLPRAGVRLIRVQRAGLATESAETSCDTGGRFRFDALPEGEHIAWVIAAGYSEEPQQDPIRLTAAQVGLVVTLRARRGGSLSGKVVDVRGKPVPYAEIKIREGLFSYSAESGPDGSFRIDRVRPEDPATSVVPGVDYLSCVADGFGRIAKRGIGYGEVITITLLAGGSVTVVAQLSEGAVPREFSWSVVTRLRQTENSERSAEQPMLAKPGNGERITVGDLTPGFYDIFVSAAGRDEVKNEMVYVGSGQNVELQAVLVPGSKREGPEVRTSKLTLKDPARYRTELDVLLRELKTPEEKKAALGGLRMVEEMFPPDSAERRAFSDLLKTLEEK
jgi:hypothetical protein